MIVSELLGFQQQLLNGGFYISLHKSVNLTAQLIIVQIMQQALETQTLFSIYFC